MMPPAAAPRAPSPAPGGASRRRLIKPGVSLTAQGEPVVWLMGGCLALSLVMILGLLALVLWQGGGTFWPVPVAQMRTVDGASLAGEVTRTERYHPRPEEVDALPPEARQPARAALAAAGGVSIRRLVRTGNFDLTNTHFTWVSDFQIAQESRPEWMLVIERMAWGRFYGTPTALVLDGKPGAQTPGQVWERFQEYHGAARRRWRERRALELHAVGRVNRRLEAGRLELRQVELSHGRASPAYAAQEAALARLQSGMDVEFAALRGKIDALNAENKRYRLRVTAADGREQSIPLADIVRAYPANRLGPWQRLGVYLDRWWEFLSDEPREANSEGGVMPAIFGTVAMTLIMSLFVVPFGVLAALYLREYAKSGPMVSAVRVAINNLAGVPSIVFGVFGLGFFSYIVGVGIDQLFFAPKLPTPTYGTGGLLWAALTLALLTLPVVIVATEEALAAVPNSMREGSYACGASKWQTIERIVLPRALPGIITGVILAMARGAGEVAPLMLVGAVKLAPELPVDTVPPFLHLERSFMHLGFHIFDLGFQSQNSEAAKPMVFTTTLLLIAIVALLNLFAVWLRARLRRRFTAHQF